ncbi:MAG: ABC transporter permease [Gammaproteobacteria bacterium]|nr:ABC transporter permease [Gammaproteobacteria bacterium]
MIRLIVNRLWQAALVLLVLSYLIYGLIGLMPGDPIDLMLTADPKLTTEDVIRLKSLFGLDQPIYLRWWHWLQSAVRGDFGFSRLYAAPVFDVLWPALANTAVLLGSALVLALVIAIPAGIYVATRPRSFADYLVNLVAFAGISVPSFWFALVLIVVFAVHWGVLPAGGTGDTDLGGAWSHLKYLVLPIATLAFATVGDQIRFMRGAMIEALRQDYVRTARAKGLSERRVVIHHAARNALNPIVTVLGLQFGALFSGALVTEIIFGWPGMGRLIFDSIMGNDFNLALIALMLATAATLLGNLLSDLLYAWLDPRVSYE